MKNFLSVAAFICVFSLLADVVISKEWTFFPVQNVKTESLAVLTSIPESLNGVKGKKITFDKNDFWSAKNESAPVSSGVFMQEIISGKDMLKVWGYGARSKFEILLNGRKIVDHREYGNRPFEQADKENFIAEFSLKKGKNLLIANVNIGAPGTISFAFGEVPLRNIADETPTVEKLQKLAEAMEYPAVKTKKRCVMEKILNNAVIAMDQNVFKDFVSQPYMEPKRLKQYCEKYPILYFYESAIDKTLNNIKNTQLFGKEIALFMVYNTGYVIKTADSCFGIDIDHRRAVKLAEVLDFLLITHKHADHYNSPLMEKMKAMGKPIISNFYDSPFKMLPPAQFDFKNISVKITKNYQGANPGNDAILMNQYLIKCGQSDDDCIIYHTGDASFHENYVPDSKIDFFICNPRPGGKLLIDKMIREIKPQYALISHSLEMRHCKPFFWILPYGNLSGDMDICRKYSKDALMPFWGEKFIWRGR